MAKRKAARRTKNARRAGAGRSRARKAAPRKRGGARKAAARRRATAVRPRKAARTQARARKATGTRKATAKKKVTRLRKASAGQARRRKASAAQARTAPALNRARRTIGAEGDVVPTPPSSLNLDRSASAARTGRRELHEKLAKHTETGPALTGGDIDADWESAYSVGDEAPGGDNPTPDQDIVDDIGKALGVEYEDNEELKGEKKISDRDKNRWELDPASSDDYDDR